jgi:Lysyl oxidase
MEPPPVFLLRSDERGPHQLRFQTEIVNTHTGVLELRPKKEDCDGDLDPDNDRAAYQRIYRDVDDDGVFTRGVDGRFRTRLAGCTRFHPEHDHWHFEDFAQYELRNDITGQLVAQSSKVSFCMTDSRQAPQLVVSGTPPSPYFTECDQTVPQGISVGWTDVYPDHLPGQELDVRGLLPGYYCFIEHADPANRLVESNDRNNSLRVQLLFDGSKISRTGRACLAPPDSHSQGGPS